MKQYELVYSHPQECDNSSSYSFGDHGIEYLRSIYLFRAEDDFEAVGIAKDFLAKGTLEFGARWSSPSVTYFRRLVSLCEVHDKREVLVGLR